ncbi:oxidoreductase [Cardiobacteriaceae bacterium TAE3-ERU3]|nr:oxidoreductase [Cardiobacteriaceae bacterium TAE3-ERU3]
MKAIVVRQEVESRKTRAVLEEISESQLPQGEVRVAVDYSTLNYKDALAITGRGKIIRHFPMVPGIDFAGRVLESTDQRYRVGDEVVLTGWGVGEKHWGGLAEQVQVAADWLVPLPAGLNTRQAMVLGTAGFTAMLCVQALQRHGIEPQDGAVLVTGASGGVGSVAVALLAALGFEVCAVTGRVVENGDYLCELGAHEVLDRAQFDESAKPLEAARWAAAVDTVGSTVLAKVLAQIQEGGAVAACGLAGGADLPTTVMPFILRGVSLLGINSVTCPYEQRVAVWSALAELLPASFYQRISRDISLDEAIPSAKDLLAGRITGRVVVCVGAAK